MAMNQAQLEALYNNHGIHMVGPFQDDATRFVRLMQPLPGQDVIHRLIRMALTKNRNGDERINNLFLLFPGNESISEVIDIEQVTRQFIVNKESLYERPFELRLKNESLENLYKINQESPDGTTLEHGRATWKTQTVVHNLRIKVDGFFQRPFSGDGTDDFEAVTVTVLGCENSLDQSFHRIQFGVFDPVAVNRDEMLNLDEHYPAFEQALQRGPATVGQLNRVVVVVCFDPPTMTAGFMSDLASFIGLGQVVWSSSNNRRNVHCAAAEPLSDDAWKGVEVVHLQRVVASNTPLFTLTAKGFILLGRTKKVKVKRRFPFFIRCNANNEFSKVHPWQLQNGMVFRPLCDIGGAQFDTLENNDNQFANRGDTRQDIWEAKQRVYGVCGVPALSEV